jgi:hypothetical protein
VTESVDGKARRLLATGRVHVPDIVRVVIDGDTGRRTVELHGSQWQCSCEAFEYRHTCSHVDAVALLTAPPPTRWVAPPRRSRRVR